MHAGIRSPSPDLEETLDAQVFRKCHECRARPASIRCQDCNQEGGRELFCYGCSRKVHASKPQHGYVYATFKDMLLEESAEVPAKNRPLGSNRKEYQTFGDKEQLSHLSMRDRLHDHEDHRQHDQYHNHSKQQPRTAMEHIEQMAKANKENLGVVSASGVTGNKAQGSYDKYLNPRGLESSAKSNTPARFRTEDEDDSIDDRIVRLQPMTGNSNAAPRREPLRQVQSNQNPGAHHYGYEQAASAKYHHTDQNGTYLTSGTVGSLALQRETTRGSQNTNGQHFLSPEHLGNPKSQHHGVRGPNGPAYQEGTRVSSPTPNRSTSQNRLLAGSSALKKGSERGGAGATQPTLLHSPFYVESLTELHRTEMESLQTKHRIELERLETDKQRLEKMLHEDSKELRSRIELLQNERNEAEEKALEMERVAKNLKTQNGLLKEENELLRANATDAASKEVSLLEDLRKVQRECEIEIERSRERSMEDLQNLRREYEEHFAEQVTLYAENLRNKDNILRCKDEMIHNLEKELDRLRRIIETKPL